MHKSDDKTNFNNYRPISVLPCFSKSNPIKSDILKNLQYGFRNLGNIQEFQLSS